MFRYYLTKIAEEHKVKIVYACESGSRAWGFASPDSDFDVRFLYLHHPEWYLSLKPGRDVIEHQDGLLDMSGWDLRKALLLLAKLNPSLIEWLNSPIVYYETHVAEQMRNLLLEHFSATLNFYHYLHMARGNYEKYLQKPLVRMKKYLYVLRPLFACFWLERGLGIVPMEFSVLLDTVVDDPEIMELIADLVRAKCDGLDLEYVPKIIELDEFIAYHLARLEKSKLGAKTKPIPWEKLDSLFLDTLERIWGSC